MDFRFLGGMKILPSNSIISNWVNFIKKSTNHRFFSKRKRSSILTIFFICFLASFLGSFPNVCWLCFSINFLQLCVRLALNISFSDCYPFLTLFLVRCLPNVVQVLMNEASYFLVSYGVSLLTDFVSEKIFIIFS